MANFQTVQTRNDDFWDNLIARLFVGTILGIAKLLWGIGITLVWIVLITVAAVNVPALGVLTAVAAIGLIVGGYWLPVLWYFAPLVADWRRGVARRAAKRMKRDGEDFLIQTGLISDAVLDELRPEVGLLVEDEVAVFRLETPIPGLSPRDFVDRAKKFEALLDAKRSLADVLPGGGIEMTFYLTDPLDVPVPITEPASIDPENMRVECAVNAYGDTRAITFGDQSGMVVGGAPGSGKTAGVSSFLLPLALSEHVSLSVIDGKGGSDWGAFEGVADWFHSGADDLESLTEIEKYLAEFHADMVERVRSFSDLLGTSNFWNVPVAERAAADVRFNLLVVDECHELFEQKGKSKEEKALMDSIERYITAIVKRGRSAGCFVILITQKPTAEALPTSIRDNSGIKVALRVLTRQAETAVLGASSADVIDMPDATDIPPSRKGGAVLGNDEGEYEPVRFFYMEEARQREILTAAAALTAAHERD